jgi:hypothetical protein
MKTLFASALFASAVVVGSLASAGAAQAAAGFEGPQIGASHVQLVRDGCGPGRFRGPAGYCRRMGYRPPPPRCPPYTHPTPYGCRRD